VRPRPAFRVLSIVAAAALLAGVTATPALAHDNTPSVSGPTLTSKLGVVASSARLAKVTFAMPTVGHPQTTSQSLSLTRNPSGNTDAAFTTPNDACDAPGCVQLSVTVPAGSQQTLYARAAWTSLTQYAHVWGVSPSGTIIGRSKTTDTIDKSVGGADVTPLASFTVPNPEPGVWKIQYRAVFGVKIPVRATVALSKGPPLQFPRLNVLQLADSHLTQHLTYNIVFVNRKWTTDEVKAFRAAMPTEYRQSVLAKQSADGNGNETGLESTALNWQGEHYRGTDGTKGGGYVPYFEPTKYTIDYRFLSADINWTSDLFAAMKRATTQDIQFPTTPPTGTRRIKQGDYLAGYDARSGKVNRGAAHLVTNPTKGDAIDAFTVEDWVFQHRGDTKYRGAFTNVETGKKISARFINPDPGAYFDPFYTAGGTKNLDRLPQGPNTSFSFFILDTFGSGDGNPADANFRPNAYHFFDVSKHMVDPDLHEAGAGPNDSRVWGGRYRFFLHDLGAGPNVLETQDGFTANTPSGSADKPNGDPPIWDYTNDPQWAGLLVENTARDVKAMLFSRLIGNYLYRPIPADVFFLASNNWVDCYSNPQCSPDGISFTDLKKVFNPDYIEKNLGAAVPGVTFTTERGKPGLQTYRYLGCAANRAIVNPDPTGPVGTGSSTPYVLAPDPTCVGKKSDRFQEGLEYAKSRGDTVVGGANDLTVNTEAFRAFVEENRAAIAPQPAGQFTLTNISVVFPGAQTWALPAIVGGIALGTPNNEGWGILNNLNDRVKGAFSTDCAKSKPVAPGCNGTPEIAPGSGFSYTIQHEASHFLGLLHPHDYQTVDKDSKGNWTYYGTAGSHYPDFSMAPTTYLGDFAPYSVLDQDIIQRGHTAEYLSQVQDYLADAYTQDGIAGAGALSSLTKRKVSAASSWQKQGSALFACGDYLHAERAMRNASLAASGTFGPVVAPRQLKPGEKVLLAVNPQAVYGPDGGEVAGCVRGNSVVPPRVTLPGGKLPTVAGPGLAATGANPILPVLAVLLTLTTVAARRRTWGRGRTA
jgi:hypothetical protein